MADYALLGVAPDASDEAVRRARATHVKAAHPDLVARDKAGATKRLIAVNDAFARIMASRSVRDSTLRAQPWRRSNSRTEGSAEADRARGGGPAAGGSGTRTGKPAAQKEQPSKPRAGAGTAQASAGHDASNRTSRPFDSQPDRSGAARARPEGVSGRSTAFAVDAETALELGRRGRRVVGARVWHEVTERAGGFYPDPLGMPILLAAFPSHQLPNALVARSLRIAVGRIEIAVERLPERGRPEAGRDFVVIPEISVPIPGRVQVGRRAMCLDVVDVIDRGEALACRCRARGRPDLEGIVFEAVSSVDAGQAGGRQAAA